MSDQLWRAAVSKNPWWPLASLLLFLAGAVALVIWLAAPFDSAERRLCDQAVDALLHSDNLVEIKRAGLIIHEIPCDIGRRL